MKIPKFDFMFEIDEWDGHCGDCGRFAKREGDKVFCKCGCFLFNVIN